MKVIGLDIGTTSLCGILLDTESTDAPRSVTEPNDTFIATANTWEKLQDPAALIAKLKTVVAALTENTDVAAIGITGQMHGIVYLDENGNAVGPLTIWQDGRGDQPYRDGMTYVEALSGLTGYSLATGYGAVTHFYNTVNGLIPPSAVKFCTIHDYAAMVLTGAKAPLVHPSDAASFGLYDLKNDSFDTAAIEAAGMDPSFFPEVAAGYAVVGRTAGNIPVAAAIGDNQASVIGSVSDLEHSILVNVGTGSQISCVVSFVPENSGLDCRPLTDGKWLLAGSSLCGGRAYAILEKFLRDTAALVSGQPVKSAYPAMDRLMADYPAPQNPLKVNTEFSGTRKQPEKRGFIENIGIDNLTMGNLCDGVMNGMVAELYERYEEMLPYLTVRPTRLIGSGNGLRFNRPLARRFSDAFGLPLSIPSHREEAAFGAALFSTVAAKISPDIASAQALIRYNDFN